jgi:diguanylate cyclase (GGDEF)-like protein
MQEHKQTESELRHRATHDGLTGLPNRTLLLDRLTQAIRRTGRDSHNRLAVVFFDLDSFKKVNDDFGHQAGDRLLREVGTRLCQRVRASDTVARYGGDEFVLVQPGLKSASDAERGVRMLTELFGEPFSIAGRRIRVNASIGVAIYPDDAEEAETLLRRADAELYTVKRNKTRGRVADDVSYLRRPRVERNPGSLLTTPPSPA